MDFSPFSSKGFSSSTAAVPSSPTLSTTEDLKAELLFCSTGSTANSEVSMSLSEERSCCCCCCSSCCLLWYRSVVFCLLMAP